MQVTVLVAERPAELSAKVAHLASNLILGIPICLFAREHAIERLLRAEALSVACGTGLAELYSLRRRAGV